MAGLSGPTDAVDRPASNGNPLATADQLELERLALDLLQHPAIIAAKDEAAGRFRILGSGRVSDSSLSDLDSAMEEWAMHYLLLAANSDANYPRVLGSFFGPPHRWFGLDVPGCRGPGTAENPDNSYTVIPIDPAARYRLDGWCQEPVIGDCPFHLTSNLSQGQNLATLHWKDVARTSDGRFSITVDAGLAGGRSNHLQSDIDTRWLFIRDCRYDWAEKPNAYTITRLDPPSAPPLSREQIVLRAARWIVDDAPMNWWFREMVAAVPANSVTSPAGSAVFSGQPAQRLSRGRLDLSGDRLFLLCIDPADFSYFNLSLNTDWEMTPDFWDRLTSMNAQQARSSEDGCFRFVFGARDLGCWNWINTAGIDRALFLIRFQAHDTKRGRDEPSTTGRIVTPIEIAAMSPNLLAPASAAERSAQLAERRTSFARRYASEPFRFSAGEGVSAH